MSRNTEFVVSVWWAEDLGVWWYRAEGGAENYSYWKDYAVSKARDWARRASRYRKNADVDVVLRIYRKDGTLQDEHWY